MVVRFPDVSHVISKYIQVGLRQLDEVMKSYGLPVGPITLADEVIHSSYVIELMTSIIRSIAHQVNLLESRSLHEGYVFMCAI